MILDTISVSLSREEAYGGRADDARAPKELMRLGRRRARRRRETSTRQIETFYEALYNFWGGIYFFGAPTPYVDGCAMPLMLP